MTDLTFHDTPWVMRSGVPHDKEPFSNYVVWFLHRDPISFGFVFEWSRVLGGQALTLFNETRVATVYVTRTGTFTPHSRGGCPFLR